MDLSKPAHAPTEFIALPYHHMASDGALLLFVPNPTHNHTPGCVLPGLQSFITVCLTSSFVAVQQCYNFTNA